MSGERKILRCDDVAPLLVFYTCDEVSGEEREQIATHLANCSECSAQLLQEDALHNAIERVPQAAAAELRPGSLEHRACVLVALVDPDRPGEHAGPVVLVGDAFELALQRIGAVVDHAVDD